MLGPTRAPADCGKERVAPPKPRNLGVRGHQWGLCPWDDDFITFVIHVIDFDFISVRISDDSALCEFLVEHSLAE